MVDSGRVGAAAGAVEAVDTRRGSLMGDMGVVADAGVVASRALMDEGATLSISEGSQRFDVADVGDVGEAKEIEGVACRPEGV